MIRQIFKIDITTQTITRYAGTTAMDASLVTTFTSRDKVPIGVQFLDGDTNKTADILPAGAQLRVGMRRYTGTGAMLALADTYTLTDGTAEMLLDLNTSEMASYMDALPDPVNTKPAYIEFEVTKADGSERVTYATQAATIRCEVIPEGAEPPAAAAASAANASASATAAASSASAAATSATSAAASAAAAASTAIGTVRTDLNNFANSRAPLPGLVFDGTAGATMSGVPAFGTGDFTVSCWVRIEAFPSAGNYYSFIGGAVNSFGMSVSSNGTIYVVKSSTAIIGTSSAAAVTTAKFAKVTYRRQSSTGYIFVNGVQVTTFADATDYSAGNTYIGATGSTGASEKLVGSLRVLAYNRALSAAEVTALYESETPSATDYPTAKAGTVLNGSAFTSASPAFTTHTSESATGFSATSDGSAVQYEVSAPVFSVKTGDVIRVTYTLTLNSGSAPKVVLAQPGVTNLSSAAVLSAGTHTVDLVATADNSAARVQFYSQSAVTDFALTGINITPLGLVGAWDFTHLTPSSTSAPAMPNVGASALSWTTGVAPSVPWSGTIPGPNVVKGTPDSNSLLQSWQNPTGDVRMSFGDINSSDASPALKICGVRGLTDSVELALVQNEGGLRTYGGYFNIDATTANLRWVSRRAGTDTTRITVDNQTGTITLANGLVIGADSFGAGRVYRDSDLGLVIVAKPGATTDVYFSGPTGNYIWKVATGTRVVQFGGPIIVDGVADYADNAAAVAAGLPVGKVYRTGDALKIVH